MNRGQSMAARRLCRRGLPLVLALGWAFGAHGAASQVSVLHAFTDAVADGKPAGGAWPVMPPAYDSQSKRLYGATFKQNVVYRFDLPAAAGTSAPGFAVLPLALKSVSGAGTVYPREDHVPFGPLVQDEAGNFYLSVFLTARKGDNRIVKFNDADFTRLLKDGLTDEDTLPTLSQFAQVTANLALAPVELNGVSGLRLFVGGSRLTAERPALSRMDASTGGNQAYLVDTNGSNGEGDYINAALTVASDGWVYVASDAYLKAGKPAFIHRVRADAKARSGWNTGYETVMTFSDATGYPGTLRMYGTQGIEHPFASSLVDGGDGWLYGSTLRAGPQLLSHEIANNGPYYYPTATDVDFKGTIYRVKRPAADAAADGKATVEILHKFQGGTDGEAAAGPLVIASDGNLYGTTMRGGKDGKGTLFQVKLRDDAGKPLDQAGAALPYAKLYDLADAGGQSPVGLSVHAEQPGKVFGATVRGGGNDAGLVFVATLPTPAAPDVVFATALTATAASGQAPLAVSLSWAAQNVEGACKATSTKDGQASTVWQGEGKQPAVAEEKLTLADAGEYVFALACANADGVEATSETTVTVTAKPVDPVDPVDPGDDVTPPSSGGGGGPLGMLALLPIAGLWMRRRR